MFSFVVRTHGSALDWQAERHRLLESSHHLPGGEVSITANQDAIQEYANLVVNGPSADTTAYYDQLARARRSVERTERALSEATEEWRKTSEFVRLHGSVSRESIANALDPGATLVHFLTFMRVIDSPSNTPYWREPHYAAFRISKIDENTHTFDFIDLGSGVSLNSLITDYRAAIDSIPPGRRPSARDEAAYRRAARSLYDRIWAPLFPDSTPSPGPLYDAHHDSAHTDAPLVLIVPDAQLHKLDFNTLLSPAGELVIERWRTHLLSSGADLLKPRGRVENNEGMLAASAPKRTAADLYSRTSIDLDPAQPASTDPNPVDSAPIDPPSNSLTNFLCVDFSTIAATLPGADNETRLAAALFSKETSEPATVLSGNRATETRVKQEAPGKRIVHLATHGFVCDAKTAGSQTLDGRPLDPLLKTGLVFAPAPGQDDGLLTAQEVTCLDLRAVDWVILSACGSGLGEVVAGEGMFGLRRAFEIAGARTVVMALWRLNDNATQHLVQQIYANRLAGASPVDAIREAELARLAESRQRFNRLHPAVWGGIVAEGDWR